MKLLNINGFNVLHMPHPSNLISIRVAVGTGSNSEMTSNEYGTAHYLEHMFFKGSENKSIKEVNNLMYSLGSGNAYTDYHETVFYINTTKTKLSETTDCLLELVFQPALREEDFNKERGVILEEYQSYADDPNSTFWWTAVEKVIGPRGHAIIGTKESITNVQLPAIKEFRRKFYTSDNMLFIVSGNVSEAEAAQAMNNALAKATLKNCQASKEKLPEISPLNWDVNVEKSIDINAQQAHMIMFFPNVSEKENKELGRVEGTARAALGGGLFSILYSKLRIENSLCYGLSCGDMGFKDDKIVYISTSLKKENIRAAQELIQKELENIQKNGFPEDVLETAKANLIYRWNASVETSSGYASAFGNDYLTLSKYYSNDELSIDYFTKCINKTTNENLVPFITKMIQKGHKLVYSGEPNEQRNNNHAKTK